MDLAMVFADAVRASVGVPAASYALASVGLNVHFGYTGLLNFGQVGFMLVGAYGTAITADAGYPLLLGVFVGIAAAVGLGLLMGLPTLRLRAEYLAIVTISIAEILRFVARSRPLEGFTGGAFGITGFADAFFDVNPLPGGRYGFWEVTFSARTTWVLLVGWGLVALSSLLVWLLVRSPWGRVLRAIRADEDAARSVGKNVFGYKLQSLVIGGVIGSLAGALIAIDAQFTDSQFWVSVVTFFAYTILILGGPGRIFGPILGSVIFWFLLQFTDSFLREAIDAGWLGNAIEPTDIGAVRFALVGLGLMLLMIFRPQGILGDRAETLVGERR